MKYLSIAGLLILFTACGAQETEQPPQPQQDIQNQTSVSESGLSDDKIALLENADFEDLDGNPVHISDYRGKVVLLDLWETWCVPCLVSFPTLQRLMDDYPEGFIVLAVSPGIMDSPDQVVEFAEEHDYTFEYLYGYDLADGLELTGIPFKIYLDPDGNYIKHTVGSRGPERDYQDAKDVLDQFIES